MYSKVNSRPARVEIQNMRDESNIINSHDKLVIQNCRIATKESYQLHVVDHNIIQTISSFLAFRGREKGITA